MDLEDARRGELFTTDGTLGQLLLTMGAHVGDQAGLHRERPVTLVALKPATQTAAHSQQAAKRSELFQSHTPPEHGQRKPLKGQATDAVADFVICQQGGQTTKYDRFKSRL